MSTPDTIAAEQAVPGLERAAQVPGQAPERLTAVRAASALPEQLALSFRAASSARPERWCSEPALPGD
jgi:hypothetical protein